MKIIDTHNDTKCKIFNWASLLEDGAIQQMADIDKLPFTRHCVLMPDAHPGYSMPIGGVAGLRNVIVPMYVGYDIGCGMCAIQTSLKRENLIDKDIRKRILDDIERTIPFGFAHNDDKRKRKFEDHYRDTVKYIVEKTIGYDRDWDYDIENAFYSALGTGGSGNHFLEIQYDENDNIWIMIHSGSRNLGHKIATYFHDKAMKLNEKWYSIPIGFLPVDTEEGKDYINYMNFALDFAYQNRKQMMSEVQDILNSYFGGNIVFDKMINIHHNYASLENHLGENLWVHRKGATLADKNTIGIIPGSMGTSSHIVRGLGNVLSLKSCSHGAGRPMGRMEFNRQNQDNIEQMKKEMEDIVYSKPSRVKKGRKETGMIDLSEMPGAYKPIEDVMADQEDLVESIHHLKPMIVVKG